MTSRDEHEMRVGFAGDAKKITVDVPTGDAPPWDLDTRLTSVGGRTRRIDAVAKVTGRARYAYDVDLPGMLHAVVARSPHAAGRLASLDLSAVAALPGVAAVIPLKEPGNRVRFVGDPIAAIAAQRLDQALDALAAVRAEYTTEAAVTDFRDHPDAPELVRGEVVGPWPGRGGDEVAAALAAAAHTAEGTWICEVQTHSCLESHGLVAWFKDDGTLEVWASTQATFGVRGGLASALELPEEKVRVHAEFVGGGFGSKFGADAEGVAAARLSRLVKCPVKLMLSRFEDHTCAGNRPSAIIRIRAGIDARGIITAWDYDAWGGPGYTGRGGGTRHNPTYFTRAKTRNSHRDLDSATDAGRAMRAPGWPQGNFAMEGMVERLAELAGMDGLAFRLLNDADPIRQAEWRLGAERFGWEQRRNPKPGTPRDGDPAHLLRGAGLASAFWGQMGGTGNQVTCRIHQDGTVEARNGAQDIGTGMKTVMAVLTAEELGIAPERIRVTMGDTNDPVGPASGGSTTTPSLAPTVRHAAWLAKAELCERVAAALRVEPGSVRCEGGRVIAGDRALGFDEACRLIGPTPVEATGRRFRNYEGYQDSVAGCQFAAVVVDARTGVVRVEKMLAVQDCGLVIDTLLAENQVLGAMIQGMSYALHEQRIVDRATGRMLNGDFLNYKISGPADLPDMEAIMFPVANGKNNVGAAGLGEPPAIAAPAAIANAVGNAIGIPLRHLPITLDKVLAALAEARRNR
ncbi:MAG: xanthine dehydrogenase family protein molybdopterin-binding subunit [Planctomycetes bacterium]|nr:xanthine dehydrogenase family protein molybdopterin-binding subunit [Planctomycetota bacterium]